MPTTTTAIVVAFATTSLDVSWLPEDAGLIVVHNDDQLDDATVDHPGVVHLHPGRNLGFGAAVNLAVEQVDTDRMVLVNPDVELTSEHWSALQSNDEDEVVTIPLVDGDGAPTSVVSGYPSALSHLLSGYRVGRLAPRGGALRGIATRLLGAWGRSHSASLRAPAGQWSLRDRWVSGAVMALTRSRFTSVGGFNPRYFLYYEDLVLCEDLARAFPSMSAVVADVPPGRHDVGASDSAPDRRDSVAERHRLDSAIRYAERKSGFAWRTSAAALEARSRWRSR